MKFFPVLAIAALLFSCSPKIKATKTANRLFIIILLFVTKLVFFLRFKEHKSLFAVPAQLASSKPGIPTKRLFFFPSVFSNYLSPTPNTLFIDASVIGLLIIDFLNLSETFTEVLKSAGLVVNSSFDYDLNLGFETLALTKIIILSLI